MGARRRGTHRRLAPALAVRGIHHQDTKDTKPWCAWCLGGVAVLLAGLAAQSAFAAGAQGTKPQAGPFDGWKPARGRWRVRGETYVQTDSAADCRSFADAAAVGGAAAWTDYVYELKARKTGGAEGFLVMFRAKDRDHFYWWNIGGWGNSRHALETRPHKTSFPSKNGRIETGRWYRVKIVVEGPSIKCYLDDKLVHAVKDGKYRSGGVGLGSWATQVEYRDVSVTAIDGAKLYGADRMSMTGAALKDLGEAGRGLRREFDALRRAGARPDDGRWGALYLKVAKVRDRLREARERLGKIDLGPERVALEKLAADHPKVKPRAEELLGKLERHRRRLEEAKLAAARGEGLDLRAVEEARAFVEEAREFRRSMFASRCPPVAFLKRPANARHGTNATMLARVRGVGSAICIYDPARPHAAGDDAKTIFEDREGYIFDMSPSFDAKRLVFAYKKKVRERKDSFHIYEIGVDGTGLRQLTRGRYHDVSPVYLPDGRICFVSTRVEAFSMCQNFLASALYMIDGDGSNLHRLEYNTLADCSPYVMDDGSILFTRWEYQDKNIFCVQGLWTINPDGTRVQLFYGNTLTVPNSIYGARQIPGTRKVICTMAAHHHRPVGAIGLIDRSLGHENPKAMTNITPEIPYRVTNGGSWKGTNWGPGDKLYPWSYGDPWPVAEDLFLVAYGGPMKGGPGRYRIYLLDEKGDKVRLYGDPKTSCFNPVPLSPRPLPHRFPGRAPAEPAGWGAFFVHDVYRGLVEKGVKRGQVKELRVMTQLPKKYNTEGPRYHDHYPIIGYGSYYPKAVYGTVPVYEDGTAYFRAPAGVELFFQALDENGKEIRRMGTVTQLTDGETQSCIGCHESRFSAPPPRKEAMARLAKGPDEIKPPSWGAGTVDYVEEVQPVLDKYCVKCHSGRAPKAGMDLSGDRSRFFSMSYMSLIERGLVEYYYIKNGPTGNFPPLASGSWVSKLTKVIESKHQKVDMDDEGRRCIYNWIDANVPYYSTWDMSRPWTTGGRDTWNRLKDGKRGRIEPEPWLSDFKKSFGKHCASCHGGVRYSRGLQDTWINLTRPEMSRVLNAHLAKAAGGMELSKKRNGRLPPVWRSTRDPVYVEMLGTIEAGKRALEARPRVDMPGAKPIPQERDFGKTF